MKRKNDILLVVLPIITVCLAVIFLRSCPSNNDHVAELRQYFAESSIVVDNHEGPLPVPETIVDAALKACPLWAHRSLGTWPEYYIRTNGYTCAVWKWPTSTWDLELKQMSDELRVWVKDDIAEVVSTPSFSPRGNPNAKPPKLTADKALTIAEMKTGICFGGTNVVDDVGDFFRIGFTTWISLKHSSEPILYAWVSKFNWAVYGNPSSHVPALTEQEIYSAIANIAETRQSYDRDQPLGIYRVADMTIVTLPIKPLLRGSTTGIWIDNATKQVVFYFEY